MIRIFTVEFDPLKKGFDDSTLGAFLAGKNVSGIEKRFFKQNGHYYWTFAVEYETGRSEAADEIILETNEQKDLYLALKDWRNDLATEKGIPPYVIFTNNQLKSLTLKHPDSLEQLKSVHGIGGRKAAEYGESVLRVLRENIVNEQE